MSDQGDTYAQFIESELKLEYERRSTLDSRALAVATSSSAFLALVFAVSVVVTGKDYKFSHGGTRGLLITLASFIAAAALGLVANAAREYEVPAVATLRLMTSDHWTDREVDARNITAGLNVTAIAFLRGGNNSKARLVVVAFLFQMAAVLGIVATLTWELRHRVYVRPGASLGTSRDLVDLAKICCRGWEDDAVAESVRAPSRSTRSWAMRPAALTAVIVSNALSQPGASGRGAARRCSRHRLGCCLSNVPEIS